MSQKNKQANLKDALRKYLRGESTLQECNAIDKWYNQLGSSQDDMPNIKSAEEMKTLEAELKGFLLSNALGRNKRIQYFQVIKYAAVFILIMSALFASRSYLFQETEPDQDLVFQSNDYVAKQVILKDSSKVLLNVGSKLIVSSGFGDSIRKVKLIGEAFFEITKDRAHPFVVQTGDLQTTVLGTSFNINAYHDLEHIKIGVLTGKVKVSTKDHVIANNMTTGATLSFNKVTNKESMKIEQTAHIAMWRESKLNIENATLSEIASQLQRYYHIKVIFDNKLDNGKRYNIRFDREPANRVMEILSLLTKKKFVYHTHQITIN